MSMDESHVGYVEEEVYLATHRYETSLNGVCLTFKDALKLAELIADSLPEGHTDKVNVRLETDKIEINVENEEDFQRMVGRFDELQKPKSINMSVYSYHKQHHHRKAEIFIVLGKTMSRLFVSGTDQEWVLETAQVFKAFMQERNNYKRYALWPVLILISLGLASFFAFLLAALTLDGALAGMGFVVGFMFSGLIHNLYTLKAFTYNSLNFSDVKNIAQKDDGAVG